MYHAIVNYRKQGDLLWVYLAVHSSASSSFAPGLFLVKPDNTESPIDPLPSNVQDCTMHYFKKIGEGEKLELHVASANPGDYASAILAVKDGAITALYAHDFHVVITAIEE